MSDIGCETGWSDDTYCHFSAPQNPAKPTETMAQFHDRLMQNSQSGPVEYEDSADWLAHQPIETGELQIVRAVRAGLRRLEDWHEARDARPAKERIVPAHLKPGTDEYSYFVARLSDEKQIALARGETAWRRIVWHLSRTDFNGK